MKAIIIGLLLTLSIAAAEVKTYKVTLSKDSAGTNRTVYIQAEDSDSARQQAKDANPGWKVLTVSEVKKEKDKAK